LAFRRGLKGGGKSHVIRGRTQAPPEGIASKKSAKGERENEILGFGGTEGRGGPGNLGRSLGRVIHIKGDARTCEVAIEGRNVGEVGNVRRKKRIRWESRYAR